MKRFAPLLAIPLALALAAGACSSSKSDPAPGGGEAEDAGAAPVVGGARPAKLRVPSGYDPKKPAPLLLMLHGYGTAGSLIDFYIKMTSIADEKGFLYVAPDGTFDAGGKRFWNATDACCDYGKTNVDDVAYLVGLIEEIKRSYSVDPARIFVMGHSNGGFMANRLACDRADVFAAAVSVSGANFADAARCKPSAPVGFLQVHGTTDQTVLFAGEPGDGGLAGAYPGADATVAIWADKNGCAKAPVVGQPIHVDPSKAGAETKVTRHEGCTRNGAAELWAIEGAGHVFSYTPEALRATWEFLEAHAKSR